jgi:protein-disulfide isomerase
MMFPRRLVAGLLCGLLLACNAAERPAGKATGPGADTLVAEVNERAISQAELDAWLKDDLWAQEISGKDPSDLFDLRSEGLERMIDERLLEKEAAAEEVSPDELLTRVASAHAVVSNEAVRSFYEENKERLGGSSFEDLAPRIQGYLEQVQRATAIENYRAELRQRASVSVKLEPPRAEVAAIGPSLGPEDAPVTIIEFSDYQCPFCQRAHSTVKQVLERYGEQVRLVYRHYPLAFHDRARPAAEAAACANEQERFWEYHELLFSEPGDLADEDLSRIAAKSELDLAAFTTCIKERTFQATVQADFEAGNKAGVDGTPAFFINGIRLSGAQPLGAFVKLIDRELARAQGEEAEAH